MAFGKELGKSGPQPGAPKKGAVETGGKKELKADLSKAEKDLQSVKADPSKAQTKNKVDSPPPKQGDQAGIADAKGANEMAGKEAKGGGGGGGGGGLKQGGKGGKNAKQEIDNSAGKDGKEGPEGKGKDAKKGDKKVNAKNKDKIGAAVGADLSKTNVVHDQDRANAVGADAMVQDPSEIVLGDAAMQGGQPSEAHLAHEARHVGQMQAGLGGGGAPMAVTSGFGPTGTGSMGGLEADASKAASNYMAGKSTPAPSIAAPMGNTYRNETGSSPTGEGTAEKVTMPETVEAKLGNTTVTITLPSSKAGSEVEADKEQEFGMGGATSSEDWLVVNSASLKFTGKDFKGGKITFSLSQPELADGVAISGLDGTTVEGTMDEGGKISPGEGLPAFDIDIAGFGEIKVEDAKLDDAGIAFKATLTSEHLTKLAANTIGGDISDASLEFERKGGNITVKGDAKAKVGASEVDMLDVELKVASLDDIEASAKCVDALDMFKSVEVKGSYKKDDGWSLAANIDSSAMKGLGNKFSVGGTVELGYSSKDGVQFAGGFEADLKVGSASFKGQILVGQIQGFGFGAQGKLTGEFEINDKMKLGGEVGFGITFKDGKKKGEGKLEGTFDKVKVEVPVKYEDEKWSTTPKITLKDWEIPNTDKLKKEFKPQIPRLKIPVFGPIVVEGGLTFDLSAGIGAAKVPEASVELGIDLNGADAPKLTKANLKGKLECPFHAEMALGLQLGVGVDLWVADGGAGLEGRARIGMPDGDDNKLTVDLEADLISDTGMSFESKFDFSALLQGNIDLNVYARYDTLFTREKIYRKTLASYKLFDDIKVGAKGGMKYANGQFNWDGVEWELPPAPSLDAGSIGNLFPDW